MNNELDRSLAALSFLPVCVRDQSQTPVVPRYFPQQREHTKQHLDEHKHADTHTNKLKCITSKQTNSLRMEKCYNVNCVKFCCERQVEGQKQRGPCTFSHPSVTLIYLAKCGLICTQDSTIALPSKFVKMHRHVKKKAPV